MGGTFTGYYFKRAKKGLYFYGGKGIVLLVWLELCCVKVWVSFLSSFDYFILEILIVTMWHEIFAVSNFCVFSSDPQK